MGRTASVEKKCGNHQASSKAGGKKERRPLQKTEAVRRSIVGQKSSITAPRSKKHVETKLHAVNGLLLTAALQLPSSEVASNDG